MNTYTMMKKPELLAPAGSMESLMAAIQNGCDAVYLGGKAFGARATATNFGREEMQEALRYAHLYGVRVYVTVNTLYKNQELEPLLEFVGHLYEDGVDGVILQDLGAAQMIRRAFPEFEIHASTQMTIHNLDGARYLADLGFRRVVLARELNLQEIREIVANAPIEVETFIHGALCVSYSGQCLMSSLIGGRSGNRGRCAQPCRLPYQLINRETQDVVAAVPEPRYLLSPKDISTLEILPELIQAGIVSLKMEGRLKRPEYTASVTRIYRKYIDLAMDDPKNYRVDPDDLQEVAQMFNRGGFSSGYYQGKSGRSMMSFERPKNWGIPVGEVISYDPRRNLCKVKLTDELDEGDGIEVWTGEAENPGTMVHSLRRTGNIVTFSLKGMIRRGNPVYRTSRKSLLDELTRSFGEFKRKIGLSGKIRLHPGEVVGLHFWDQEGNTVEVQSKEIVERAQKQPVTRKKIMEQMSKMGNVPFELVNLSVEMKEDVFLPISQLNALRREAVEKLTEIRIAQWGGPRPASQVAQEVLEVPPTTMAVNPTRKQDRGGTKTSVMTEIPRLAVYLQGPQFTPERFIALGVSRLYLNLHTLTPERVTSLKALGGERLQVFAVLPRIARNRQMERVRKQVFSLLNTSIDGFLVGNLGEAQMLKEYGLLHQGLTPIQSIADASLNLLNRLTLDYWAHTGMRSAVLSPELTLREMEELMQWGELEKEAIVYGHLPSMVSEYCPVGAVEGGMTAERACSRPGKDYGLLDRMGHVFPVMTDCANCRSVILNPHPLLLLEQLDQISRAGFSSLRMDLTIESEEDGLAIVAAYLDRLQHPEEVPTAAIRTLTERIQAQGFTKGHFFRGVE